MVVGEESSRWIPSESPWWAIRSSNNYYKKGAAPEEVSLNKIIFQTVHPFTTYLDIFIHYKASGTVEWEAKRIKKIFKGYMFQF